jgi:hypothetical protein
MGSWRPHHFELYLYLLVLAISVACSYAFSPVFVFSHFAASLVRTRTPPARIQYLSTHPAPSWSLDGFPSARPYSPSVRPSSVLRQSKQESTEKLLDLDSPLSQVHQNDADDGLSPPLSALYGRDQASLEKATQQFLSDRQLYPVGKLSDEDLEAITGLMAAWAKKRSLQAALIVEKLLKRIIDDLKAGNANIHVRTQHYTLTIDAWSKSGATGASDRAQQIHDAMTIEWEQTGDAAIRPTVMSCTTLVNAWAKSNETRAPIMAERILQSMIEAYQGGATHMKPDAVTFSTVMDAYSRSPGISGQEACRRCEELFDLMDKLGVRKNVYTFSALQNVYARSRMPRALERTMEILRKMQHLYEGGDVFAKPNCRKSMLPPATLIILPELFLTPLVLSRKL